MSAPRPARGPAKIGRSVVVAPGQPAPTGWEECRRVPVEATQSALALSDPTHPAIADLARAWSEREAIIIEVDDLPDPHPTPIDEQFWSLHPGSTHDHDHLRFYLCANSIDVRPNATWPLFNQAIDAGCEPGDGITGDVILPDGSPAWIDGGPLEWISGIGTILPRLHLGIGAARALGAQAAPDDSLTQHQTDAVSHRRGPARIIAPAGSGKTRVLTERLRLLARSGLSTAAVTLVAYNVRAQTEMAERLGDVPGVRVSTLHALALRVLRSVDPHGPRPEVIDEIGVRRLLEPLVPSIRRRADSDALEAWVDAVNSCRDSLATPSDIARRSQELEGLDEVVVAYRARLRESNHIDYSDMVLRACEALIADPLLLNRVRSGVGMLLVDEFQDLTPALMLLVRLLAGPAHEVFCVGDDDQTIYGFSGATPRWLVEFDTSFPGANHHALTVNHRCPADVVAAADSLLRHNTLRVPKTIDARVGAPPTGLHIHEATERAPEIGMTTSISDTLATGVRPGEIAVLARTNAGLIAPYIHLRHAGIPCRPPTGLGTELLNRSGVAALLAWVDLATSSTLDPASVATALQRPRRATTPKLTQVLVSISDLDALERFASRNNNPKYRESLTQFCADIRQARKVALSGATSRNLIDHFLDELGIASTLDALDSSQRAPRRATHRDQLEAIRSIAELEPRPTHLAPFIVSHLPTSADRRSTNGERVTLDTIHRVKGLEWPHVHLAGVADGSFPHRLADDTEEERRIFHVGITRCSTGVHLWCDEPPSPFVDELTNPPNPSNQLSPIRSRRAPVTKEPSQPRRSAPHGSLYEALVAWRRAIAREIAKPAFTVFSNSVLVDISQKRPSSHSELAAIAGVGPTKLERWGDDILALVSDHPTTDGRTD